MEIIPEGKNFRLVHDNELPEILDILEKYLPESIKVCFLYYILVIRSHIILFTFFCKIEYLFKIVH